MINNFENSTNYVRNLFNFDDERLEQLEEYAIRKNIPIVTREVLNFMIFLSKKNKSKNILEIGSAIGYSSIFLASVAKLNQGKLTTIEIDESRFLEAKSNFERFNLDNIEIFNDDALNILPKLNEKYDFIFIDASKSKYMEFFKYSYEMLNDGGIIFIDNILFKGYVSEKEYPKRYKTIVKNLDNFINYLNEKYNFVLLPFGDGVGIVTK